MDKATRLLTPWEGIVFVAKFMVDYIKDKCKIMVTHEWSLAKLISVLVCSTLEPALQAYRYCLHYVED